MRHRMYERRVRARGLTVIEAAMLFAIVGSLLAIAVPAFVREFHASRFVEPVEGLRQIGEGALAYASEKHDVPFPASAPLTPPTIPRGTREADPPGVWDHPTWTALHFRAAPEGVPHAFAFGFDSQGSATDRATFVAHAHADLDGDGVRSTFEIRGHAAPSEAAALEPGMFVDAEVE